MKAIKSQVTRALNVGAKVPSCDNSGAKVLKIVSVIGHKTVKGRLSAAGVGDLVIASVVKGRPDMRKQLVPAVVVRQKREFKRPNGIRVCYEDNAVVVCKDNKGNPKGTIFKGPIAKEASERWPPIAKAASVIL